MKAVLVFCEGRHDVVFAQRSLGVHGGCRWVGGPMGNLPSPFGESRIARKGLIARRLEKHAIEEYTLQAASHPPLPCFESAVENTATETVFFMIRAHGDDQVDPILDLFRDLDITVAEPVAGKQFPDRSVAAEFHATGQSSVFRLCRSGSLCALGR